MNYPTSDIRHPTSDIYFNTPRYYFNINPQPATRNLTTRNPQPVTLNILIYLLISKKLSTDEKDYKLF
jgi:hypothetical protein